MVGRIFEGFGLKKQGSQGLVLPKFNHDKYLTDPCPQVHKSSFFKKHEINQGVYADPSCEYISGRGEDDHWTLFEGSLRPFTC